MNLNVDGKSYSPKIKCSFRFNKYICEVSAVRRPGTGLHGFPCGAESLPGRTDNVMIITWGPTVASLGQGCNGVNLHLLGGQHHRRRDPQGGRMTLKR